MVESPKKGNIAETSGENESDRGEERLNGNKYQSGFYPLVRAKRDKICLILR